MHDAEHPERLEIWKKTPPFIQWSLEQNLVQWIFPEQLSPQGALYRLRSPAKSAPSNTGLATEKSCGSRKLTRSLTRTFPYAGSAPIIATIDPWNSSCVVPHRANSLVVSRRSLPRLRRNRGSLLRRRVLLPTDPLLQGRRKSAHRESTSQRGKQ